MPAFRFEFPWDVVFREGHAREDSTAFRRRARAVGLEAFADGDSFIVGGSAATIRRFIAAEVDDDELARALYRMIYPAPA